MNMAFSYLERMRMQFCMKLLDIYLSIRKTFLSMISKKTVNKPEIRRIVIVYRISDVGYPKEKPDYINNENCLRNAVEKFPLDQCFWHVIADNVSESTLNMICKYIPLAQVDCVSVGHGAGTFRIAYEYSLSHFFDDDCVYFLENDYLHKNGSLGVLKEGLLCKESDYVTLYDHPDKYGYVSDNKCIVSGGESTRLLLTSSSHWKITNSTTMTFAAFVGTLRKDKDLFWKWTKTKHPFDFQIFMALARRRRVLISPVPGYSTHGEIKYLSPLADWRKEV